MVTGGTPNRERFPLPAHGGENRGVRAENNSAEGELISTTCKARRRILFLDVTLSLMCSRSRRSEILLSKVPFWNRS